MQSLTVKSAIARNLLLAVLFGPFGAYPLDLIDRTSPPASLEETAEDPDLTTLVSVGQKVRIILYNGKEMKGRTLAVEPNRLYLALANTFDFQTWRKVETWVPANEIVELRLLSASGCRTAPKEVDWEKVGKVSLQVAEVVLYVALAASQAYGSSH